MKYYDIREDFEKYPDLWCYVVVGGRTTGKTYSALKYCYKEKIKFVFVKRTIEDVKLLCNRGKLSEYEFDASPFKPINRDLGCNIQSRLISDKGIGGFWRFSGEDSCGEPIGYILALNAVQKFKGFDLSECDIIIFDEFIPQPWERINSKEGEQLLDLYVTVARDREKRGKKPLKLVLLANAVRLFNPVCETLEITDKIADMQATGQEYDIDRDIMTHVMPDNFIDYSDSPIYKAMSKTAWGKMAYENSFAYDDVSNVGNLSIKGYRPIAKIIYKNDDIWYLYRKDGNFIMNTSRAENVPTYDLTKDNDVKRFNIDVRIRLLDALIDNKVCFSKYTMYYVVNNFTKLYKL